MNRYLISQTSWPLEVLYQLCRDLREIGEKALNLSVFLLHIAQLTLYHPLKQADDHLFSVGAQKGPVMLEDAARHINKAFTIVATDR